MNTDECKRRQALNEFVTNKLAPRDAEFDSKAYRAYLRHRIFFWAVVVMSVSLSVIGVLLKEDVQNLLYQRSVIFLPWLLIGALWLVLREAENLDYLDEYHQDFRALHENAKLEIANADTETEYAAIHRKLLAEFETLEKKRGRRHRALLRRGLNSISKTQPGTKVSSAI